MEGKKKKTNKKRIKEAKKRFDKSTRGTREERVKELLNINKELEETRRRANNCLLQMEDETTSSNYSDRFTPFFDYHPDPSIKDGCLLGKHNILKKN